MAAPGFRVFSTQYSPVQYGGRKLLSRAFRNRFLELHFDQLPTADLETILEKRCALPRSYSQKMVAVLGQLQKYRRGSAAFAGREGRVITQSQIPLGTDPKNTLFALFWPKNPSNKGYKFFLLV